MNLKKIFIIFMAINFNILAAKSVNVNLISNVGTTYYYNDELYTGKATYNKDRFYYKDGKANGKWLTFYTNGNLKSICSWTKGHLDGKYIVYSEMGKKIMELNYSDGKENGAYAIYYDNGSLRIRGQYQNGKPIGKWEYFDVNGKIVGVTDL